MRRVVAATALSLLALSCSTGEGDPTVAQSPEPTAEVTEAPAVDTVSVELGEWSVLPDPDGVQADEITFEVDNTGQEIHEFVIAKTALEADQLPTAKDGSVDEDDLDVLGEIEDLEPGDDGDLKLELEAGDYVLFCNIVETMEGEMDDHQDEETHVHYKLGMRTGFTVS